MSNPQITVKPNRVSLTVEARETAIVRVAQQGPSGVSAADFKQQALNGYPHYSDKVFYDSAGVLVQKKYWNDVTRSLLLLTQTFTYNSAGDVAQIVSVNAVNAASLTLTARYNVDQSFDGFDRA